MGQSPCFAERFFIINSLDFGKLVTSSKGGSIVLSKDELENPKEISKGLLRISEGKMGQLRYFPKSEKEHIIYIQYPNYHYLDNAKRVWIKNINQYSTTEVFTEKSKPYYDIEIGGELVVKSGFKGKINGEPIPVTIHLYHE